MNHSASSLVLFVNYSWIITLTTCVSPVSRHNVKLRNPDSNKQQPVKRLLACACANSRSPRKKTTFPMILMKENLPDPANQSHARLRQWRHTHTAFTHAKRQWRWSRWLSWLTLIKVISCSQRCCSGGTGVLSSGRSLSIRRFV